MKVFLVITVARQVNGEMVLVKTEKGFTKASQADALSKKIAAENRTKEGKLNLVQIDTPQGSIPCYRETGVFEIEIEEGE